MTRYLALPLIVAMAFQAVASLSTAQEKVAVQDHSATDQANRMKTILEVVKSLEEADYAPIVEISFDDGVWEVEAYKADVPYELSIDPQTGEVISEHRDNADTKPSTKALLLSALIEKIEKAGYTNLHDISFEHRTWEAEVRRDGMKRELRLDPLTGEVVEDRVDD